MGVKWEDKWGTVVNAFLVMVIVKMVLILRLMILYYIRMVAILFSI